MEREKQTANKRGSEREKEKEGETTDRERDRGSITSGWKEEESCTSE